MADTLEPRIAFCTGCRLCHPIVPVWLLNWTSWYVFRKKEIHICRMDKSMQSLLPDSARQSQTCLQLHMFIWKGSRHPGCVSRTPMQVLKHLMFSLSFVLAGNVFDDASKTSLKMSSEPCEANDASMPWLPLQLSLLQQQRDAISFLAARLRLFSPSCAF